MAIFSKPTSNIAGGKLLLIIVTFVYSMIGILYFKWNIFFIVYLFWFENLIGVFSLIFKIKSVKNLGKPTEEITVNGKEVTSPWTVWRTRLFLSMAYGVFIVIGLGIAMPFAIENKDESINAIISSLTIILFMDMDFNVALIMCLGKELVEYFKDFKIEPKYSEKNPFPFPKAFEKNDIMLHLTIIFSGVFVFAATHEALKENFSFINTEWVFVIPAILLVTMKFVYGLYTYFKSEKEERNVTAEEVMEIG